MMAFYHCFNPDIPKYGHSCNRCMREITSGTRWHCHKCPDFDMCDSCREKHSHEHELTPIAVSGFTRDENVCFMDVGLGKTFHADLPGESGGLAAAGVDALLRVRQRDVCGTLLLADEGYGAAQLGL